MLCIPERCHKHSKQLNKCSFHYSEKRELLFSATMFNFIPVSIAYKVILCWKMNITHQTNLKREFTFKFVPGLCPSLSLSSCSESDSEALESASSECLPRWLFSFEDETKPSGFSHVDTVQDIWIITLCTYLILFLLWWHQLSEATLPYARYTANNLAQGFCLSSVHCSQQRYCPNSWLHWQ